MRIVLITLTAALGACAARDPRIGMHAPNPNGCYVMVFRGPAFTDASDLLNGPGRWPRLDHLADAHHRQWANEIRSLRVGDAATVVTFAEENYLGLSTEFPPGSESAVLPPQLTANIESLQMVCSQLVAGNRQSIDSRQSPVESPKSKVQRPKSKVQSSKSKVQSSQRVVRGTGPA